MIGSRDSYVEFSRKRPGTDDSPRVRADGGCVGKSSLRRTGQCVVKKSDDANPCRSHASAPLTNWWGPRIHYLRDRRMAWCVASCMDEARYPFHPYLRPPPGDVSWTPAGIVSSARVYMRYSTAPVRRRDFFHAHACICWMVTPSMHPCHHAIRRRWSDTYRPGARHSEF